MAARHFARDDDAGSMTSAGLNPRHLRPSSVTSERLTAVESANDRVEFLLDQLLLAERAAREDLVTSVERAEREQMAQILLDSVAETDEEPGGSEETEAPGDRGATVPLSLDEIESGKEPDPLDVPLDEPESVQQARVPVVPEVIAVQESPGGSRDPFLRPEVRVSSSGDEVLASKERNERIDVGAGLTDEAVEGRAGGYARGAPCPSRSRRQLQGGQGLHLEGQ